MLRSCKGPFESIVDLILKSQDECAQIVAPQPWKNSNQQRLAKLDQSLRASLPSSPISTKLSRASPVLLDSPAMNGRASIAPDPCLDPEICRIKAAEYAEKRDAAFQKAAQVFKETSWKQHGGEIASFYASQVILINNNNYINRHAIMTNKSNIGIL